jgi:uncharacterized membrane protein YhhN
MELALRLNRASRSETATRRMVGHLPLSPTGTAKVHGLHQTEVVGGGGRWAGKVAMAIAVADTALAGSTAPWARPVRLLTKPALIPAVAAAVRARGGRPSRPVTLALAGSWAGDVALLSRSDAGLLGGVAGFAVAHLAYLTEIRRRHPAAARRGPETAASMVFGAVFVGSGAVLWRRLDTTERRRLRLPVLGYAALVTTMGAAAVRGGLRTPGPTGPALATGGVLFVISDGLVASTLFGSRRRRPVEAAVMATYATAQALLAGALAHPRAAPYPGAGRARSVAVGWEVGA